MPEPSSYMYDAPCCANCHFFNGLKRNNCKQFGFNADLSSVCDDYRKSTLMIFMPKKKKKNKNKKRSK